MCIEWSRQLVGFNCVFLFFKRKTAYEMRISDWSSDVCSSDLVWRRRNSRSPFRAALYYKPCRRAHHEEDRAMQGKLATVFGASGFIERNIVREQIGRASCRDRVCQYV